jgi:type IV pilus assembly protein PilV
MKNMKPLLPSRQHGITLIESLVAIVVMALGILGILGVQMRTLADTQTGVRRAQAIRLIEDLSERMKVNPSSSKYFNDYLLGWGAATSAVNCTTATCTSDKLAKSDIHEWKTTVKNTLPLSDVSIFAVDDETIAGNKRQLGVMISWRENEKDSSTGAIFNINATTTGSTSCPANSTCHLQYIQLTSRCATYKLGGSTPKEYCPGE